MPAALQGRLREVEARDMRSKEKSLGAERGRLRLPAAEVVPAKGGASAPAAFSTALHMTLRMRWSREVLGCCEAETASISRKCSHITSLPWRFARIVLYGTRAPQRLVNVANHN